MKTMNRFFMACILACMVLGSGCIKLWTKSLDIKTYMVETERTTDVLENPLADKLWMDMVHVLPPFNVRNIVLRKSDVEYETSYYTELLLSPSENFRNNFYTWFSSSGIFHAVSLSDRKGMSHRLVVTVLKFYGDTSSEPGTVVLEIKATLLDEKTKGMRVLLSKNYRQQVEVSEQSAGEVIRAFNQALQQILSNCEADVIEALAQ